MPVVRWTAKLPALVIGIVLLIGGLITTWRGRVMAGIVLIALGGGFVAYSMTIKDWCEVRGGQSAWSAGFGGSFHECLKLKGWLSF